MDTPAQWPQDVVMKPMEAANSLVDRKVRAHKEQAFNCPRCNSTNTKFCYYNNYSLSQPRFFCKACRRYWTQGGSLRNIPVGGGSRKNKRPTPSLSPSPCRSNNKLPSDHLAPPRIQNPNPSPSSLSSRVMYDSYSFMPLPVVGSGFHHLLDQDHQFNKSSSSLSFSLEHGSNYGVFQGLQDNDNGDDKLVFPFEDLNQDHDQDRDLRLSDDGDRKTKDHDLQDGDPSNGFWSGVIGGGSW